MAKRIASCVYNINNFPDDVLSHILSFLPFKEAVRTSILSTRWRYLFSLISNLDLEVKANNVEEWKLFMSFVDRLLFHLDMPSVVRFRLRCGGSIFWKIERSGVSIQRVADWICALIRSNIQEFDCMVCNGVFLPPILFSCESLVVLKLTFDYTENYMQIIPADRICLPNVKFIQLEKAQLSNDGYVGKLFSGCPVLEDLVLDGCYFISGCVRFSVSNQNLKTLTIKNIASRQACGTRILINAPNLVVLNQHVSSDYSLEFVDVISLSEAIITSNFKKYVPTGWFTSTPGAISWIQNVKALRICFYLARDLQRSKVPIPLFEKMTYLKIWFQECRTDPVGFDPIGLEYFLARCVVLETLVFEESKMFSLQRTNKRYSLQESQLAPLLHHLKTIEIRILDIGHTIVLMKVIKFFLKSAKVLEVLKFHSKKGCPEEQFKITKRIMNFPRASKKCTILLSSGTSK